MILVDKCIGSRDLIDDGYLSPDCAMLSDLVDIGGDFSFLGSGPDGLNLTIGGELKALSGRSQDALDSWKSGRFVGTQLPKMVRNYQRIYLIIEGVYRPGENGCIEVPKWVNSEARTQSWEWVPLPFHTDYRQFDNWLNSLTESGKVRVKRTLDRFETARVIMDLYLWWQKDYDDHRSLFGFDTSQAPVGELPSFKRRVAKEIDGIGWNKSEQVATYFPSVQAMSNAPMEDWMAIPGIGSSIAKKAYCQMRSLKELPEGVTAPKKKSAKKSPA